MDDERLGGRLIKVYAKHLGELERLENPPKRLTRLLADREAYEAAAPDRERRIAEIKELLPHLAYVIRLWDKRWEEGSVQPKRPKMPRRGIPPNGISGAAADILREASQPLSIAEIVAIIADDFGFDISTVSESQRYHTAVNNALMHTFKDDLVKHPGYPTKWSMKPAGT